MAGVTLLVLVMSAGFRSTAGVLIVPLEQEFGWSAAPCRRPSRQPDPLRPRRAVRGGAARALRRAQGDRRRPARGRRRLGLHTLMTRAVAARAALGRRHRHRRPARSRCRSRRSSPTGGSSRRRGLVTGILTASNATGQLIFLPVLAWIVTTTAGAGRRHGRRRRARGRRPARRAPHARPARRTSACCPTAATSPSRRAAAPRQRVPRRRSAGCATARRSSTFWLLAGQLLRLRRVDQRPDRHAPDPGGARPRVSAR